MLFYVLHVGKVVCTHLLNAESLAFFFTNQSDEAICFTWLFTAAGQVSFLWYRWGKSSLS